MPKPDSYMDEDLDQPIAAPGGADEQDGEEQTALLPKSICPGMKPGEELVLLIKQVLDSEYVAAYAPKKKGAGMDEGAGDDNPGGLYD